MKSQDLTLTQHRAQKALNKSVNNIISQSVPQMIKKEVEACKIFTGHAIKFYPYLDKVEVDLDNGNTIICKVLHRFGGDIIDFYTPLGEADYCEKLHEPCIIPRGGIECLVVNIDDDSAEYLLLGYFINEELIGSNPASDGNFKITFHAGDNEYWIKFGANGLDVRLPSEITTSIGRMDNEMTDLDINPSNVYNKEEVYTKEEIDKLISDLKKELSGE